MLRVRYVRTNPRSTETWAEYRRELSLRRLQTTQQRRQLIRSEVNGFYADQCYWDAQQGQKGT